MSSASCMLSMRKENLKEILVERENRALAKRVLNVKSFCDPNGKDLDDYRRHQRMVQVRQEFHHYSGTQVAAARQKAQKSPSKPRVAASLSESNLHHLDSLLCPWDLPKANHPSQAQGEDSSAEKLAVAEVAEEKSPGAEASGEAPEAAPVAMATFDVPSSQVAPKFLDTQLPPVKEEPLASHSGGADQVVAQSPVVASSTSGGSPVAVESTALASPEPRTNLEPSHLLDATGGLNRSEPSTATMESSAATVHQEESPKEEMPVAALQATQPQAADFAGTAATPSNAELAASLGGVGHAAEPDRHADPFGDMGMFDKPPEFKTKRRRERPAD